MTWPFKYTGNLTWLPERTILLLDHGSRAYGTHRPDSDYDYKGVAVAPVHYRTGFINTFQQAEIKDTADAVIYNLPKFMKLAADCNPTLLEMLFIDEAGVRVTSEAGALLRDHRTEFLSKKALHTFRGYAMQQLKRIQRHRAWLLNPPAKKPVREDYDLLPKADLPTAQITAAMSEINRKMDGWSIDFEDLGYAQRLHIREQIEQYLAELVIGQDERFMAAARLTGLEENFIELLARERRYKSAMDHFKSYQDWKNNRNAKRAKLEAEFGYDTKHGMHLVRLMRMCREILEEGVVHVRRPDAEELLAIRNGDWSYDKLMEWAVAEDADLKAIGLVSELPRAPNRKKLDLLCQEITEMVG
jgi:hypothetical protein